MSERWRGHALSLVMLKMALHISLKWHGLCPRFWICFSVGSGSKNRDALTPLSRAWAIRGLMSHELAVGTYSVLTGVPDLSVSSVLGFLVKGCCLCMACTLCLNSLTLI